MRCTTCGEFLKDHEGTCPTCGAVVAQRSLMQPVGVEVRSCPRCGHLGTGIKHFQRPGHVALLLALSACTWFTGGLGGLAYFLARRRRRICAECGLGWDRARAPGPGFAGHPAFVDPAGKDLTSPSAPVNSVGNLPRRGVGRRALGVALVLFGVLLIAVGVIDVAVEAIAFGSAFAAAGTGSIWWGLQARETRRRALMSRLQRRVLLLATERSGTLTVTEVAASLNMSLSMAENVLDGMDDGLRVRSDVTDEGIIVYEFPELRYNPRLESGSAG